MKALFFLISIFLAISCKTQTAPTVSSDKGFARQIQNPESKCPEGGTCSVEVFENKTLAVLRDDAGVLYPSLGDGENTVVVYTFLQNPEGTVDGDYSETLHFEIPASSRLVELENETLEKANVLFGKHCNCPGEAGYYKIVDGSLFMEQTENAVQFELFFKTDATSHKVSRVTETVQL